MALPDVVARFNRIATNHLARPVARLLPPLAVVVHRGRRTGRTYRTPVLAFHDDGRWTIALTYGPDRDWVRNVLAAEGCVLERARRRIGLRRPRRRSRAETEDAFPAAVRAALRLLHVEHVLELRQAP